MLGNWFIFLLCSNATLSSSVIQTVSLEYISSAFVYPAGQRLGGPSCPDQCLNFQELLRCLSLGEGVFEFSCCTNERLENLRKDDGAAECAPCNFFLLASIPMFLPCGPKGTYCYVQNNKTPKTPQIQCFGSAPWNCANRDFRPTSAPQAGSIPPLVRGSAKLAALIVIV